MNGHTKYIAIIITIIVAAVSISLSYGKLTAAVEYLGKEVQANGVALEEIRDEVDSNYHKIRDLEGTR